MKNHYCNQKSVLVFHLPAWAQGDHVTCGIGGKGEEIRIILNPVKGARAVQLLQCRQVLPALAIVLGQEIIPFQPAS